MIAQVLECGDQVVAYVIDMRPVGATSFCRLSDVGKAIFQLEDDALGGLPSNAGNSRQARNVGTLNRGNQLVAVDSRQYSDRKLRTDATDSNEPLEQLLLERREEPVQLQRVLADMCVDAQRDFRAGLAYVVVRGQRDVQFIPNTVHIDRDSIGMFVEDTPSEECDHPCAGG